MITDILDSQYNLASKPNIHFCPIYSVTLIQGGIYLVLVFLWKTKKLIEFSSSLEKFHLLEDRETGNWYVEKFYWFGLRLMKTKSDNSWVDIVTFKLNWKQVAVPVPGDPGPASTITQNQFYYSELCSQLKIFLLDHRIYDCWYSVCVGLENDQTFLFASFLWKANRLATDCVGTRRTAETGEEI